MATFITLLLIPVPYSIFVLDLKIVKWESPSEMKTKDTKVRKGDLREIQAD
ncbi:MAG: hypothetical protein WBL50_01905 [Candidatus Acidiferrum sp.]